LVVSSTEVKLKVYLYDRNGYYLGKEDAEESPKEPGVFLIPANATTIKPPATVGKQIAKFSGGNWTIENAQVITEPMGDLDWKIIDNNTVRLVLKGTDGVKRKVEFTLA
jgi:hypothetical protein